MTEPPPATARRDFAMAADSITPHQRRRITRAVSAFLACRPELGNLNIRFDVILVSPPRPPRHITDTWRKGWS
jgi:putative endonuclease